MRAEIRGRDVQVPEGFEVFKKYGGPGGIKEEFEQVAAANPEITKLVVLGKTHQGQDIVAMKVTRGARNVRDGARPSVLYIGAQHAREWITPEMTTRLLKHVLQQARSTPSMRKMLATNELWFLPVANPDGYDYTFTEGNRLWRKNLRDNNGDGQITVGDGVDLNRNFAEKWGYDNEGSADLPSGPAIILTASAAYAVSLLVGSEGGLLLRGGSQPRRAEA